MPGSRGPTTGTRSAGRHASFPRNGSPTTWRPSPLQVRSCPQRKMKARLENRKRLSSALIVTALLGAGAAQSVTPRLRVVSPADGAYIAGTVRLVAEIAPASAERQVARVTF